MLKVAQCDRCGLTIEDCACLVQEILTKHIEDKHDIKAILGAYGSFRRMTEAYWAGELTVAEEREIEERTPKETLVGYKPVC